MKITGLSNIIKLSGFGFKIKDKKDKKSLKIIVTKFVCFYVFFINSYDNFTGWSDFINKAKSYPYSLSSCLELNDFQNKSWTKTIL